MMYNDRIDIAYQNDAGDVYNGIKRFEVSHPAHKRPLIVAAPDDKSAFVPCDEPVEKARRYMVRTTQAIGAKLAGSSKCGWRNHKQAKIGGTACKWGGITETIDVASKRLRGDTTHLVQIEHMDALRLIERYNNPDVLMYLDPPYLRSTRKGGALYNHEMDEAGQRELLSLIVKSRAKIIISGYNSEMYNSALADWHRDETRTQTTSAEWATEVIWMNYEPPMEQITIFEGNKP